MLQLSATPTTTSTGGCGASAGPSSPRPAQEAAAGLVLGLAFVDVATGAVRSERPVRLSSLFINQVLPFFDQYALSHRFWSPDGTAIALPLVGAGDVTEVTVIPADGSEPRIVATGRDGVLEPLSVAAPVSRGAPRS